jgi:hypothetical protein
MKILISFLILFFSLNFVESSEKPKIEKIEIIAEVWQPESRSGVNTEQILKRRADELSVEIYDKKLISKIDKILPGLQIINDKKSRIDVRLVAILYRNNNLNDTLSFGIGFKNIKFNQNFYNFNLELFDMFTFCLPYDYKMRIDFDRSFRTFDF